MYQFLDKILPLKEIENLQQCVLANEVYFYQSSSQTIDELKKLDYLSSLESLLGSWTDDVDVHLLDLKDEASTKKVRPASAREYFDKGMGLLFNDINLSDEYFQKLLNSLSQDLGLSSATLSRNLIYATPENGGTATHFDQNINLIIQLHGEKSWWIEENKSILNPLTRHTLGTEADPELASYQKSEFPDSINYKNEYKLSPGSILFVPRGAWHKTHASSEALALNFTFSVPSWADIISMGLRARIIQSEYWRDAVLGLNREEVANEKVQNFQSLIDSLKEDIQTWKAEDILGFVEFSGMEGLSDD